MKEKEFTGLLGATAETCLCLMKAWKGTGRVVIGDSWFGSVKSAINLMKSNGLYSILLVKTAHKLYPRALLAERELARGEWVSATATIEDVNLIATKFVDLQVKQFISTCSCTVSGQPHKTKHHGDVSRPKVCRRIFDVLCWNRYP